MSPSDQINRNGKKKKKIDSRDIKENENDDIRTQQK